jgi:hypothetical protein
MSSNGRSDLADEVTAGAYADSASGNDDPIIDTINRNIRQMVEERTSSILRAQATPFEPRPPSPSTNTIADAFRQLTLADAAESRIASESQHILTLRMPEAIVSGDADGARVASGTTTGGKEDDTT